MPKSLKRERLLELLSYEPETGIFRWLESRGRVSVGQIAGSLKDTPDSGYILIRIDGETYRAHRLAWLYVNDKWPPNDIDHINGIRHDNRFCNLREATRSENLANSRLRSCSTSGLKGAYWEKRRLCWYSNITFMMKNEFLGYFSTAEEAHAAYVKKAKELRGAFARAA